MTTPTIPRSDAPVSDRNALPPSQALLTATVAVTTVLAPLNSTMIIVALPSIAREFHTTIGNTSWLLTSYLIAMAAVQPIAGKVGDRVGRRRLVTGSLLLFAFASASAAFAPNLAILMGFRTLQAISAAVALPNATALVRELVPGARRAAVFGVVGAVAGTGAAIGPVVGGILTQAFGWQAIFSANLVPVLLALVLCQRVIPRLGAAREFFRFDVVGAVMFTLLLVDLAGLFAWGLRNGITAVTSLMAAGFVGGATFFLWYEARQSDPVLQIALYRHRTFAASSIAMALSNLSMYSTLVVVPVLLTRRGLHPGQTGLLLVALPLMNAISAPIGGRLSDRFGRRWPSVIGLALLTASVLLMALAGYRISLVLLTISLAVAGASIGASWPGLQAASVEAVRPEEAGTASGLFSTARYLGSILGVSVVGSMFQGSSKHGGGIDIVFWMVVVSAILASLAAFAIHDRPVAVIKNPR